MDRRRPGRARLLLWIVIGGLLPPVVGVVVAGAPLFWLGDPPDIAPAGRACAFQDDPGSGQSQWGVEVVHEGIVTERRCVPLGYHVMSSSGEEFEAAARVVLDDGGRRWDSLTRHIQVGNTSRPSYADVWTLLAAAVTATLWLPAAFAARRAWRTRRRPEPRSPVPVA